MGATSGADSAGPIDGYRPVSRLFRAVLVPFVVLAIGATAALYLRSTETDRFFAWSIEPPLTAALLGSAYGGTLVFFALTLRERVWANTRLAVSAPLTLSTALLVATLLHLDRFHLDEGGVAGVVAWIWLVVYVIVPPTLVAVIVVQRRLPGGDPPVVAPLPGPVRVALVVLGALSLLGGAVLFAVPEDLADVWPWPISALTGRAIASWLLGLGVAAVHAAIEDDLRRLRAGVPALAVIGALGLVALLRHGDDLTGGALGTGLTVAYLATLLVLGGGGALLERRSARPAQPDAKGP